MIRRKMKCLSICEDDKREDDSSENLSGEDVSGESQKRKVNWRLRRVVALLICLIALVATFNPIASAQDSSSEPLPFEVSNPKHLQWSTDEAGRIYTSACELVARSIRPEKPPRLKPKFLLILGTKHNEAVHTEATSEVHLKSWNPARFAEAMVLMASREVLKTEDVVHLTRDTLMAAEATVSVHELKAKK
jgi:hypothetical protein